MLDVIFQLRKMRPAIGARSLIVLGTARSTLVVRCIGAWLYVIAWLFWKLM
jgi:hypothetical protein